MKLFFTDLDNTLIFSHRHSCDSPFVWIEYFKGNQQSWITKKSYDFFCAPHSFKTIPVTTRSFDQYIRLKDMAEAFRWDKALIYNGAVLLNNGSEDKEWTEESMALADSDRSALSDACSCVQSFAQDKDIIIKDGLMFYVKTDNAQNVLADLKARYHDSGLYFGRDSRKVYCIPGQLNKGAAVRRFIRRFGGTPFSAAGDSEFDVPMLNEADISFCSDMITDIVKKDNKYIFSGSSGSDRICMILDNIEMREY